MPWIAEEFCEHEVCGVGTGFEIWDAYWVRYISERGESGGAHHLGRDKILKAVDEIGSQKSGIELRAGFCEQGEDVLRAEVIEDGSERDTGLMGGDSFDAGALRAEFVDSGFVVRGSEDEEVVICAADDF